jgi:hypothetical protein
MYFIHELIDALKKNALHLDCSDMELTQEGTATPEVIKGPGYIRQEADGKLAFKLFSSQAPSSNNFTDPFRDLVLGQLVPATKYYSLRASDQYNREWTTQRIHADVSIGRLEDGRQAVIGSGSLQDIEYLDKHAGEGTGQELSISFFESIEIPYNNVTITEKSVAGKAVSKGFCRNVALFPAAGFDCRVTTESGTTTFVIDTEGRLPPRMEVRVIEAFQFILAKTVWPRVIRTYDSGSEVIRFPSALGASGKPRMTPPIQRSTVEELTWTWVLFDKYLAYILPFAGDGWHPCSRHLYAVSKASVHSVHSEALALGVAVEGICNDVFGHLCKPTPGFVSAVKSLQDYSFAWPGHDSAEDTETLRKRLPGLIGMLTKPRAIDRMHQLAAWGWIDKDLIEAWQELRNKSAHGSTPDARVSQKFIDRCKQVTDLLCAGSA